MPENTSVRAAVRDADRRRRSREGLRLLAILAPIAAGFVLVTAAVGRLAGWPARGSLALLIVLAAALIGFFLLWRRARTTTDALAARIDADAGLGGELRSAHWFESRDSNNEWAEYHLDRARARLSAISWADLYPRVHAGRAWVVTAVLTATAVALMISLPRTQDAGIDPQLAAEIAAVADQLPPDLQKRLDELLSAVKAGEPGAAEASEATLAELKDLLSKLDPELQRKLADLAKQLREQKAFKNADEGDQRADEDPDSNAGMPEDMRWAAEDLAARLANADFDRQTAEKNPSASSETGEKGPGSPQAENTNAPPSDKGAQMMREAASDPGATQLMMAAVGAMGGDSSSGPGNNQGNNCGPGSDPAQCAKEFASIAQALRKELIEASADMLGENIKQKEDLRRKTEQGTSSLGFSRITPPATLERSRAASPPAVPDARRPLLFNYFIRPR